MSFFRSASRSHAPALCGAAQLGTARPYTPASAFWDCAHRSPPDWAHTRPHLHRDQVHPPPTSAPGPSRSPAHLCPAKESVPRRHLCRHCCPPGHPPVCNTSVAQQRSTLCCNHVLCVATECHLCPISLRTANAVTGCTLPCRWLHPIRSKRKRSEGAAGRIAWRVPGTVGEDWPRRKRGRAFDCPEYSLRRESTCHWHSKLG